MPAQYEGASAYPLSCSSKLERMGSVDVVRGIIMVVMALDHVRDLLHRGAMQQNPLDLATTTPVLFFTRWITHFCAPGFVFLAGIAAFLYGRRKAWQVLRTFLIRRGIWLILVDLIVMTFAVTFNPHYNMIIFSVLWAIGVSMIILGLLIKVRWPVLLIIGLMIVAGQDLLNSINPKPDSAAGILMDFIHATPNVLSLSTRHVVLIAYSFLPWTGVMILGFVAGKLFDHSYPADKRFRILLSIGVAAILAFIVLRLLNIYGDLFPWSIQKNNLFTFLSFVNTNKYPPSLLFLCMTLGPLLILLAVCEKVQGRAVQIIMVYGYVPFFYYVIHFFLIRIIALVVFFSSGFGSKDIASAPFYFHPGDFGLSLVSVYLVWAGVVISMYPLCRWYGRYKRSHKKLWWLSYL